jgi:hypothetical protein
MIAHALTIGTGGCTEKARQRSMSSIGWNSARDGVFAGEAIDNTSLRSYGTNPWLACRVLAVSPLWA